LRMLRGTQEDFVLNEYSRSYLEEHQLAASHLAKLKFSSQVISHGDEEWSQYLEPTFRTLSVTTSQKRKMPESKYLSRGVSWRQAAGN
jgi:hypothetical protein